MTIHITPEPDFSYVSFESNVPQASYKDVISRVLETFQPGKFVLTVFANKVRHHLCSLKRRGAFMH
jgi:S-adenosylmethionine decarboxylase